MKYKYVMNNLFSVLDIAAHLGCIDYCKYTEVTSTFVSL